MKCNKCNAEWQVDASRSASITVCPFCQEKLVADKSGDWKFFDNTKELLEYVAAEYGNDALFGRKYFSDHTSPLMPQGQKNLVKQTFECGAVKILQDNISSDQQHKEIAVKQAVGKLIDTYASAKEAAERVVWEFANAIGWGMKEPTGSTATPPPPQTIKTTVQPAALGIGALMTRAWQFAEDGDWKDSADYFNKVLDVDPSYAPAFLGLLCVDLKASKEDKLVNVKELNSIIRHKYYKRAATDPAIKAQLDGYVQIICARIDAEKKAAAAEAERKRKAAEEAARRKRVQDAFDIAEKIMNNAQSTDDYRKAITAFGSIDSNYQDINGRIKGKIAECERKMQQMQDEFDKVLAPFRKKLDPKAKAETQARLQEQRKADKERLDAENAKMKADVEAKRSQLLQEFDASHKAWQEDYNRLKAAYDTEYKKFKAQIESRKAQGLCAHCGGILKGLLTKKCSKCGKAPSEPIRILPDLAQPSYPAEPLMPQMPTYTPQVLDEAKYASTSLVNQRINLAGIEWRILDVQNRKLLLISEKILEMRPYNIEKKDITWERCTLRKYLNGEFLNKLGEIKPLIAETQNSNPNNPWYGTAGGNATTDKVFLLSLDEVCRYFGDSTAEFRSIRKDKYYFTDKNSPNRIANYGSEGASWWWLRSPGDNCYGASYVYSDGDVLVDGDDVNGDDGDSGGVRPALWLNL